MFSSASIRLLAPGFRLTSLTTLALRCWTTSENPLKKLSEKSRRSPKRGLVRPRSGPARAVLAPEQRPNACSEPYSNPFSDSFKAKFGERPFHALR